MQLAALPVEELQEVHSHAAALLAVGPKVRVRTTPSVDEFSASFYAALAELMDTRTRVHSLPFAVFSRTAQYRDHLGPAMCLAAEANRQWFPEQTKTERLSMVRLYAKLCVQYLDEQDRPLVWYNIAAAVSSLPGVVDRAFPGYAASGLLGKVQLLRTRKRLAV